MLGTFITAYALELALSGTFLTGFSVYSYFTLKKKSSNKFKIRYCDVSDVIKQYKKLDKRMNDSIGGIKNEKFFN
jgi:hypothetical protein